MGASFECHFGLKLTTIPSLHKSPTLQKILHFADICAGPGGFSEYLTWRRGHPFPESIEGGDSKKCSTSSPASLTEFFPRVRGHGITLTGDDDFKLDDFVAGPVETFMPFYGDKKDGDITSWANLASFAKFVHESTEGAGVHVVMADGVSQTQAAIV